MKQIRTLYLIRHAKSDWSSPSQTDHDRVLNERGRKDAPAMAKRLHSNGFLLDLILTSTAIRAEKTAMAFAEEYALKKNHIIRTRDLYHAHPDDFFRVISQIEDAFLHAAIFSHNPGITDFVNELQVATLDHMPTCAVFAITTEANSWKGFADAKKTFLFFDFPKNPLHS